MSDEMVLAQKIQQEVLQLPPESLPDLQKYIEFLRFKVKPRKKAPAAKPPFDPTDAIRLDGLMKGYDFSPEFIKEARREMWHKFVVEDK
jgi:hypothetical protein